MAVDKQRLIARDFALVAMEVELLLLIVIFMSICFILRHPLNARLPKEPLAGVLDNAGIVNKDNDASEVSQFILSAPSLNREYSCMGDTSHAIGQQRPFLSQGLLRAFAGADSALQIIMLEFMYRQSLKNKGLANVDSNESHKSYLWAHVPVIKALSMDTVWCRLDIKTRIKLNDFPGKLDRVRRRFSGWNLDSMPCRRGVATKAASLAAISVNPHPVSITQKPDIYGVSLGDDGKDMVVRGLWARNCGLSTLCIAAFMSAGQPYSVCPSAVNNLSETGAYTYQGGSMTTAARLGRADLAFASLNDSAQNAQLTTNINPRIPLIADADVGFGSPPNIARVLLAARECGADMGFLEAIETEEQIKNAVKVLAPMPLMVNLVSNGKTAWFSLEQLGEWGVKLAIYPGAAGKSVLHTIRRAYKYLMETGKDDAATQGLDPKGFFD
ncbi:hypothetical protein ETB97_008348, partial [Aspergillus alliaceus]